MNWGACEEEVLRCHFDYDWMGQGSERIQRIADNHPDSWFNDCGTSRREHDIGGADRGANGCNRQILKIFMLNNMGGRT